MRLKNKRCILFNGPPRSGKDTGAEHVQAFIPRSVIFKFSWPHKRFVRSTFDLSLEELNDLEQHKEEPSAALFGRSYRQFQIDFSEKYMKPLYGEDVFGQIACRWIEQHASDFDVFLCSDSGFRAEAQPVAELFTPKNVLVIQLSAPDTSFKGDSRSYWDLPAVKTVGIINKKESIDDYALDVKVVVADWLKSTGYQW